MKKQYFYGDNVGEELIIEIPENMLVERINAGYFRVVKDYTKKLIKEANDILTSD